MSSSESKKILPQPDGRRSLRNSGTYLPDYMESNSIQPPCCYKYFSVDFTTFRDHLQKYLCITTNKSHFIHKFEMLSFISGFFSLAIFTINTSSKVTCRSLSIFQKNILRLLERNISIIVYIKLNVLWTVHRDISVQ